MKENANQAEPRHYLYESRWWKLLFNAVWLGPIVVLITLLSVIGLALSKPDVFLSPPNVSNLTWIWLAHAIIVPVMVLIIASGGLDLSVGAVVGLTGVVVALLAPGLGLEAASLIGIVLALLIGLVNGLLVGATRIHGALVTLATATLMRGMALTITRGAPVTAKEVGWLSSPTIPWILLAASVIVSVVWALLLSRRRAKSGDDHPSWISRLIFTGVPYVLSSLLAGFVGIMYLSRLRIGMPTAGAGLEVDEILLVLLGGTPLISAAVGNAIVNIAGAVLAALAFAIAQNASALAGAPAFYMEVGKGALLLVVGVLSYLYYLGISLLTTPKKKGDSPAKLDDAESQATG